MVFVCCSALEKKVDDIHQMGSVLEDLFKEYSVSAVIDGIRKDPYDGDVMNEIRYFSLRSEEEGIYSVEYNSSLSTLQALSICISVMECRKSSQYTESRTYVAKQVHDDPKPVQFASFPPLSPVGRV